jgi:transposase-like protein
MTKPPFCPNPHCPSHFPQKDHNSRRPWYYKAGFYHPAAASEPVRRYLCKTCGKKFSRQTFSINYFSKKNLNLNKLSLSLSSGMSIRAMARFYHVAPTTVIRKIRLLARQSVAINSILDQEVQLSESLVADGFESFVVSQYFPNNFNFLMGKESQYIYFFNYVQLHRKGKMTARQKIVAKKLKERWPLPRNNQVIKFTEVVSYATKLAAQTPGLKGLDFYTDEKAEYRRCTEPVYLPPELRGKGFGFRHHTTSSHDPRTVSNDLFSVNYIDRECRKDLAEHHRETTCHARETCDSVERMCVYSTIHNFFKDYRINPGKSEYRTHADAAGIPREFYGPLLKKFTTWRFFYSHLKLNLHQELVWRRGYGSPLKRKSQALPAYVFA